MLFHVCWTDCTENEYCPAIQAVAMYLACAMCTLCQICEEGQEPGKRQTRATAKALLSVLIVCYQSQADIGQIWWSQSGAKAGCTEPATASAGLTKLPQLFLRIPLGSARPSNACSCQSMTCAWLTVYVLQASLRGADWTTTIYCISKEKIKLEA